MNPLATALLVSTLLFPHPPPITPGEAPGAPHRSLTPTGVPAAAWPLDPKPEIVAGFAPPTQRWSAGHRGVDLLGEAGASVHSALKGTVTFAGPIAGRGVVVVSHGSSRTTYEPVEPGVRPGEEVNAGAVIGTLQSGLSHCPPRACLHWGLVEGDEYRDPLTLFGQRPVRLLPFGP